MRVLLITGSYPPMTCGVGEYTHSLAQALSACGGLDVAVLTSAEAEGAATGPVEVFPWIGEWKPADFASVKEAIRRFRPDLAHLQYPTQGYRNTLAWQIPARVRAQGLPVVQTWHEQVPRRMIHALPHVAMSLPPGDLIVVRPGYEKQMPWWSKILTAHRRKHLIENAPTIPRAVLSESERASLRRRFGERALLVFFGFLYENKGIDDIFAMLDPQRHHLVLIGDVKQHDPYQRKLLRRIEEPPFAGSVTLTGFLPPREAARLLAAADAVVLPFRDGGGSWNTSLKGAALQGTFVLTTSVTRRGYDCAANVYYAKPGDVPEMKLALEKYLGRRSAGEHPPAAGPPWETVAREHLEVYRRVTRRRLA